MKTLVLAVCLASTTAVAAPRTVAVSYFDNNTGKPEYDPLQKGLADMLITDLTGIGSIQVVEREKLNQVLAELKLSRGTFIDPKTAQTLGKGLSAELILTGHYVVSGDTLRIDARVVQVATGAVTLAESVEGKKDDFFSLEKDLVDLLVRAMDLKLEPAERRKLRGNSTQSYAAWSQYSAGLDAADRGDDERARALFAAALDLDPNYAAARTHLGRMKAVAGAVEKRKDESRARMVADAKRLDPKSGTYGIDIHNVFIGLGTPDAASLPYILELLTWLVTNDLHPVVVSGPIKTYPVALNLAVLVSTYMMDPQTVNLLPPVLEWLLITYPDDQALTGTNLKDLPKQIEDAILRAKDPALAKVWNEQFSTPGYHKPFGDHRAEAQKLFKLVASKLKKK